MKNKNRTSIIMILQIKVHKLVMKNPSILDQIKNQKIKILLIIKTIIIQNQIT
jgi:hypothetical protein